MQDQTKLGVEQIMCRFEDRLESVKKPESRKNSIYAGTESKKKKQKRKKSIVRRDNIILDGSLNRFRDIPRPTP